MSTEQGGQKPTGAALSQEKRDLLRRILQEEELKKSRVDIGSRPAGEPPALSFVQEGLWFLDKVNTGADSYRMLLLVSFDGSLDTGALQRSLCEIVRRHEVLRSSYPERDGQAVVTLSERAEVLLSRTEIQAQTEAERERELDRVVREEYEIPFDLARGPLFRAKLIQFGEAAHCLLLMVHHIASDGWSGGVLYQELCAIYAAFSRGEPSPLPEPRLQYADFAAWQRRRLQGAFLDKQLDYWRQSLQGASVLRLPRDRPEASLSSFHAITEERILPGALCDALRELSRRQGVTLFVTMLSAFEVLMHRYSGQDDIVIGTPVLLRNRPELESLIGLLVNMAALRTNLGDDPSFRDLMWRTRQIVLGANDHADVPFERVVQEIKPERIAKRNPIFQVVFALDMAYQPVFSERYKLPGLTIGVMHKNDILTHLDMEVYLRDTGDGIAMQFVCGQDLFDASTVTRMLGHYVQILESAVSNPDGRISELPMLLEAERREILQEWNQTDAAYPRDASIVELYEAQAERWPTALAVTYGEERLTYGELNARANRVGRYLRRRGVGPDVPVGVLMERSVAMVIAWLGVLKAGGAYVPLDPEYPKARLAFMLEDTAAPVLLTAGALKDRLPEYAGHVACLDEDWGEIGEESAEDLQVALSAETLAYVIYTSGSTGQPKGVSVPHRAVVRLVCGANYVQLERDDRMVQASNASFDAATFEVWGALLNGAPLVGAGREVTLNPRRYKAFLAEHGITVLFMTTALFNQVAREAPDAFGGVRAVLFGGESADVGSVRRVLNSGGRPSRLLHVYGPTESTTFASWYEVSAVAEEAVTVPIGRPISNTQLYVLDTHRKPVPIGVSGELYVGGDGLARGYWRRAELTAEKFVANPFHPDPQSRLYRTGDLVRWTGEGAIEFLGRVDNQVKLRGFRIELGEVEAGLREYAGVRDAVVLLREDEPGEKRLVAYVVPETAGGVSMGGLREHMRGRLPGYMVPAAFVELECLPLTPNGKVDRKALPEPEGERQVEAAYVMPRNELEERIAGIWRDVLGIEKLGIDDNFFDLGGHSLLLVRVHEQIKKLTGRELPIVALFQFPTIRSLARHLGGEDTEENRQELCGEVRRRRNLLHRRGSGKFEPIAVIGMAGRFPGAQGLDQFWRNLREGVESIRFFTAQELCQAGVDESLLRDPKYVPAKGYLENADLFDAQFFGYSPREAKLIDPQQRLFLEVAWEALEGAGYAPGHYGGPVGVYAGSSENTYWFSILRNEEIRAAGMVENALAAGKDFLATRVAYKLDLHGPAVTIQTACSTSLVAVHEACKSLLSGECEIALAGGVSVSVPLVAGYPYQADSIGSPDGHCRAFDAAAQGTVGGSGVGVVVLKRLANAQSDGDMVHAVILGTAINNDGSMKVGYTAPSVEGQSQAIAMALVESEVEPSTINYIETHGTGTKLGDPIEIAALKRVFANADTKRRVAIGSLKTNVGHMDAAAGVAGLIKTVLALKHRQLPPSLHFQNANPELHLEESPFYVNSRLSEWEAGAAPRRAGVSSFGIGGTNAHVVLEEAPILPPSDPCRPHQLLVLSARTAGALDAAAKNLAEYLKHQPEMNLADAAYTLQMGRKRFGQCRTLVCRSIEEAMAVLQQPAHHSPTAGNRDNAARDVVFMFPGQGSQYVNMAREIYDSEPLFREVVDECCEKLLAELGCDLRKLLYPAEGGTDISGERLTQTQFAQPALFVIGYALARLWISWGIRPAAMIGHSLGEYIAACVAGVMSLDDALRLVAERARLMGKLPAGKMLAVPLAPGRLEALLGEQLAIATVNGPELSVLSGPEPDIDRVRRLLAEGGIETRLLHTSHAFHSPMMEPILEELTKRVGAIALHVPEIPYLSNVSGCWITGEEATDPSYYARHLRQTVQFSKGLEQLFLRPDWVLLEVGPGQTLATLSKRHPAKPAAQVLLSSSRHPERDYSDEAFLLETLGQLWTVGIDPDWEALHAPYRRRRVWLPTYPFERQRYWIEPDRASAATVKKLVRKPDPADWIYMPSWRRVPIGTGSPDKRVANWICFTDSCGLGSHIETELHDSGAHVIRIAIGEQFAKLGDGQYALNPNVKEDYDRLARELVAISKVPDYIVHLWSVSADDALQTDAASVDERGTQGFFSLVYLVQALESQALTSPLGVAVITTHVYEVNGDEAICPEKAMVLGPCKVIGMEYPNIRMRAIDVVVDSVGDMPCLARALTADLCAPWRDPVVAYRGRYRWVQSFEPVTLEAPAGMPAKLRDRGVYLITGGLGDVGLEMAGYLARTVSARLVLVGRTAIPAKEQWPQWLAGHDASDITSRKIRRVLMLEELGASVLICTADVADERQMATAIDEAEACFGALHGVIHAAGAAKRGIPIRSLRREDCEHQFRPKVQGLMVLERLLQGKQLDFCVVNSSLASVMGVMDFVTYTAAHLFMDAFVYRHNRQSATPWITINWDNWNIGDDGVESSRQAMVGFYMNPHEGVEVFGRLLSRGDVTQVLVSTGDMQGRIDQWIGRENPAQNTTDAAEPIHAQSAHPRPALSTEYEEPRNHAERVLVGIWRDILGIDRVGIHDNFFEMGGDSVLNIQITARAKQAGLELTPKQVFEHQTIAELAGVVGAEEMLEFEQGVVTGEVPLTPIQQWFFNRNLPNPQHFNLPILFEVRQPLDVRIVEQAMQQLAIHHDALRLRYSRNGNTWEQRIVDVGEPITVHRFDLDGLAADEQTRQIEKRGTQLQQSLDLFSGPLIQVAYFNLGSGRLPRLLLVIHHLVVDVVSWRILLEDLQALYEALSRGQSPILPPKTASIKQWAQSMNDYAQTAEAEAELGFWSGLAAKPIFPLPVDQETGDNTVASSGRVYRELSVAETRALIMDMPRILNASINDVLLWALSQAISKWSGQASLFVDVEGHGREAILGGVDPSRTVGWFTTIYPVLITLPFEGDFRDQIKSIGKQYGAIPKHGMGFGILRYLNKKPEVSGMLAQLPKPEMSFLYMGQFDQPVSSNSLFVPALEPVGSEYDPNGTRPYLLEVNSIVKRGQFQISWTYSNNRHRPETVQLLADSFMDSLHAIIKGGQAEPGDDASSSYTENGISESDLAEIMRQMKT